MKTFPVGKQATLEKEQGWISYAIRKKEEHPAWSWNLTKTEIDPAVAFLTALVPAKKG